MRLVHAIVLSLLAVPVLSQSDLCENGYLPFKKGIAFEMTSYNHKDKLTSVASHHITDVTRHDGGFRATVEIDLQDDKGKSLRDASYFIDCTGDGFLLDMSSMLAPESFAAISAMQVEVTGDGLVIPAKMTPGQTLPDGQLQMRASLNGMQLMTLTVAVTDRKVLANEKITTPAGTFDCVKLKQTTTVSGLGNRSYEGVSWLAFGVGTVRTENYDKKGELDSYSQLTKFTKD